MKSAICTPLMLSSCPRCESEGRSGSSFRRNGSFFRTSDSRRIQRYQCLHCKRTVSPSTFSPWCGQKKRMINGIVRELLARGVSIRNAAEILKVDRKTIARKLEALGYHAASELGRLNRESARKQKSRVVEFDDLETFELTKCKPISVTLAVESRTRRILGVEVASMPAKGLLVKRARKYGPREDGRYHARQRLFTTLKDLVHEEAMIKSDSNPHYPPDVRRHFPRARHVTYLGRESSLGGQGELKKVVFDPLFSLNHTCAMARYSLSRLIRKTWCTTKRMDRLWLHLMIYADFHNKQLEV
jgi:transposase-like protein